MLKGQRKFATSQGTHIFEKWRASKKGKLKRRQNETEILKNKKKKK